MAKGERKPLRHRIALLVLVLGAAGLVAYWSRNQPVEVTAIYVLGKRGLTVRSLRVVYRRDGKQMKAVKLDFSAAGAPRRYRHKLKLIPGDYVIKGKLYLRSAGGAEDDVRRFRREAKIGGSEQRLVIRLDR